MAMILFTQRKEIETKYREWIKKNNIDDCAFNVITFLSESGLLVETMDAAEFLKELDRMCDSYAVTCFGCPIYDAFPYNINCAELVKSMPKKVTGLVKQWSEEHKEE